MQDESVGEALAQGASFFIATVTSVVAEKVGTRSETSSYTLGHEVAVRGALPPAGWPVKQLGKALLSAGERFVLAAADTGRFHEAWQLVGHWALPVTAGEEAAKAFAQAQGWAAPVGPDGEPT